MLYLLLLLVCTSYAAPSVSTYYCTSDCSSNAIHEFATTTGSACVARACAEDPWPGVYSVVSCPTTLVEPNSLPIRKVTFESAGCSGDITGYAAYADDCFECDPFSSIAPSTSARCDATSAIQIDFLQDECAGSSCSVENTPLWGASGVCNGKNFISCDSVLPKPEPCPTPAPTPAPTTPAPTKDGATTTVAPTTTTTTTAAPTTVASTTPAPTVQKTTPAPTVTVTTASPTTTETPTTEAPTVAPSALPTKTPTTESPTKTPSEAPSQTPTTASPTTQEPSASPTGAPTGAPSVAPSVTPGSPTKAPTTVAPTELAATESPTPAPTYPCVTIFDNTTNTTISNCTSAATSSYKFGTISMMFVAAVMFLALQ